VPTPTDEKVNAPGLALAAATRSRAVLKPFSGDTTSTPAKVPSGITAAITRRIVAKVRIKRRRDRVGIRISEQSVAVGISLGDKSGTNRSSGAPAVFNDDRVSELRGQLLEHQARDDVGRAAGPERDNGVQRLAWPVQSGSFQDLVLKGDAFGFVFLEPGVRRIGIRSRKLSSGLKRGF
jgi:hypothetical protein